jgi:hypothetical protein
VSPCRSLTLERQPLPKIRLLLRVSRPRPPRLWLPRHLGAIVFLEHTPVSAPAATFAPLRGCDCGGDFSPSAPTFGLYSSLIVCGAPVATAGGMLDCVCVSVSVCGLAPLLGCRPIMVRVESLYIYIYIYTSSPINTIVHPSTATLPRSPRSAAGLLCREGRPRPRPHRQCPARPRVPRRRRDRRRPCPPHPAPRYRQARRRAVAPAAPLLGPHLTSARPMSCRA